MPKLNLPKVLALSLGVLAMIFSLNYLAMAVFTEPSASPPGDNVPAPINTGTSTQAKSGNLNIDGTLGVRQGFGADGGAAVGTGLNVINGKIMIGATTTPTFPLSFKAVAGNKIALYETGTGLGYGFGIQSSILQIFSAVSTNRVGIGYGNSLTATSFTEVLTVKGSSVGVRTATPAANFEVAGLTLLNGNTANLGLTSTSTLGTMATSAKMLIGWNKSNAQGEVDFIANRGAGSTGGFAFYDYSSASKLTQLLRILGNGNVGIGTTPGTEKLNVFGSVKVDGTISGVASPIEGTDAANKDYVDALICNNSGGGGIPLHDTKVLHDSVTGQGISTVSIALPKDGCVVKFTVCDQAATPVPPAKMIIGSNPVSRTPKAVSGLGTKGSLATSHGGCVAPATDRVGGVSDPLATGVVCGHDSCYTYDASEGGYYLSDRKCHTNETCQSFGGQDHCVPTTANYFCQTHPLGGAIYDYYYMTTNLSYPNPDCDHGYPYTTPRCSPALAGEVLGGYDNIDFVCAYCPTGTPSYDPSSKNCISTSSVSTIKVGAKCSTLTALIPTAITDITFADASGVPVNVGCYVEYAYSCPE